MGLADPISEDFSSLIKQAKRPIELLMKVQSTPPHKPCGTPNIFFLSENDYKRKPMTTNELKGKSLQIAAVVSGVSGKTPFPLLVNGEEETTFANVNRFTTLNKWSESTHTVSPARQQSQKTWYWYTPSERDT